MRISSLSSGAGRDVSSSVLDDFERVAVGSSSVVEDEDSASKSRSVVTRFFVESVLDVDTTGKSSSADRVPSLATDGSLLVDVEVLRAEVQRLSVAFSCPEPADVCFATKTTVSEDGVTTTADPADVAVQTEGSYCVLKTVIIIVKHCVLCKLLGWLDLAIFPYFW